MTSTVLLLDVMAEPSIELHVQLPTSPESTDLVWIKAASVPISELAQFSTRPYRWMCYVGYCLTGVEGQLSLSMDNRAPVDYDTPDVLEEVESVYYHYPEGYDQEISPIDVQLESAISSSTSSARDPVFRRSIVGRDERDVVTGFEEWSCQAAHLIRFSKGDEVNTILQAFIRCMFLITGVAVYSEINKFAPQRERLRHYHGHQ